MNMEYPATRYDEVVEANKGLRFENGKLQAENKQLREVMAEALANCETCRGIPALSNRRCARCLTFRKLLGGKGE